MFESRQIAGVPDVLQVAVALATLTPSAKASELAIRGLYTDFVLFREELLTPPPLGNIRKIFHSLLLLV